MSVVLRSRGSVSTRSSLAISELGWTRDIRQSIGLRSNDTNPTGVLKPLWVVSENALEPRSARVRNGPSRGHCWGLPTLTFVSEPEHPQSPRRRRAMQTVLLCFQGFLVVRRRFGVVSEGGAALSVFREGLAGGLLPVDGSIGGGRCANV